MTVPLTKLLGREGLTRTALELHLATPGAAVAAGATVAVVAVHDGSDGAVATAVGRGRDRGRDLRGSCCWAGQGRDGSRSRAGTGPRRQLLQRGVGPRRQLVQGGAGPRRQLLQGGAGPRRQLLQGRDRAGAA
ncbi:unnamed protein product [Closterium sp. NIES-53]